MIENKEIQGFSEEEGFNYQLNRWYHAIGETAYEDLRSIGGRVTTMKEYIEAFLELAKVREKEGELKKAAYYYRAAEFFIPADASNKQVLRKKVIELMKEVFEIQKEQSFEVPYKDTSIPAYKFEVSNSRGTIVIFGGYDSYIEELASYFKYFNTAGYNVIAFEGPGQGAALEEKQLILTHSWEEPVKCIMDYFNLEDVTLIGMSLGGMLAIRAAAYEKRVKRVIAFDVMYDFYESFESQCSSKVKEVLNILIDTGQKDKLNEMMTDSMNRFPKVAWGIQQGMHVTGAHTPYDYLVAIKAFTTKECAHLVEQDVLLMAGTKDQYVPLGMLYKQIGALTTAKSITARIFTEAEHAQDHCQTSNIKLALDTITDWIAHVSKITN